MKNKKIPNVCLLLLLLYLMLLGFAPQHIWIFFCAAIVCLVFYERKPPKTGRPPLSYNPQKEILDKYLLSEQQRENVVAELRKIPEMSPHPRNKMLESKISPEARGFIQRKSKISKKNVVKNIQIATLALRTQRFEYAFKSELEALLENFYAQTKDDSRWESIHYAAKARELDKERLLLAKEVRHNPAKVSSYLRSKVDALEEIWISENNDEDYEISIGLEAVDPELAKSRLRAQLSTHGFISKNAAYNSAYEKIADSLYKLESEIPSAPISRLLNWSRLLDYGDIEAEYWLGLQKPLLDLATSIPLSEKGVAHAIRQVAFYSEVGSAIAIKATEEFLNVLGRTSEIPALRAVENGMGGYCLGTCEFAAEEAAIARLRNWRVGGDVSHPIYIAAHERYWQILGELKLEDEATAFRELGSALFRSGFPLCEEIGRAFKGLLPNRAIAKDSSIIFYLHNMNCMQSNSERERGKFLFIKRILGESLEIVQREWPEAIRPIQRHWSE
ncbi:MAG: hypothetical protein FJX23_00515 [Alphaproteobacteria bacterium]|nr:hypothetical protein [Alphaproteobacteria bacterium]